MPQYLLILRGNVEAEQQEWTPEAMQGVIEKYQTWAVNLAQKGLLKSGQKLSDEGGKVMMPHGGEVTVKDGPYIESKEVVGGYYLIKADSYDHAVTLCHDHPNFLFGSIEIREIDFMGQPEED